jgi:cytochrome c oxidase cbb3-type subunit III
MAWRVAAAAVAALLLVQAGHDAFEPADGGAQAAVAPAAKAAKADQHHEAGRKVYNFRCYFCHGYSGDAKTLASSYLTPRPRDFTAASDAQLPAEAILAAVRDGRHGTAMKSFSGILSTPEMQAVAAFVSREFVRNKARNTEYHTAENGWPAHQRFAAAFPFARGDLALDTPLEQLSPAQLAGKQLFMTSCVSCHDRARVSDEGPAWSARPVSYPRMGFVPGQPNTPPPDVVSSASVYAKHEVVPRVEGLTAQQRRGQDLFQANCAFCHGGDGSGKNWIGQFMEPKARDLTQYDRASMPAARLRHVIREGLPGTSMPAWQHVLKPTEIDAVGAYVARVFFKPDT